MGIWVGFGIGAWGVHVRRFSQDTRQTRTIYLLCYTFDIQHMSTKLK
jgi:hypothetical protein